MKNTLRNTALVLATAIASMTIAQAKPHDKADGRQPDRAMHCMKKLNLDDKQRTAIDAIKQQFPKPETQESDRQDTRKKIQTLVNAEQLDKDALEKLADEAAATAKTRVIQRAQMEHQIRQILTAEQKQTLDDCQAQQAERPRKR